MKRVFAAAATLAALTAAYAQEPQELWDQAVKAKGGSERLRAVHSLAIFLKPAAQNFPGLATNWLCVFPDRYFEFDGAGVGGNQRALVVDGASDKAAADATGAPRGTRPLTNQERERLVLNQLVFLLETAWMQPRPVEARGRVLTVEASGRSYKLFLDGAGLPERIVSLAMPKEKHSPHSDFRLARYVDFQGVMLPRRVTATASVSESVWDADYEVGAKYNPKLFERMPDLANGPEPWRMR